MIISRFFVLVSAVLVLASTQVSFSQDTVEIWGDDPAHQNYCGKYSESWNNRNPNESINDAYNRLAHGQINEFIPNGFIVAVEKETRSKINAPKNSHRTYLDKFVNTADAGFITTGARNRLMRAILNQSKPQFVSHVYKFSNGVGTAAFNQHAEIIAGTRTNLDYSDGINALLSKLQTGLASELDTGNYSHIFFMSMGWHNDQRVSICRYRMIIEQTAKHLGEDFNPLVIGMTWPSSWFSDASIGIIEKFGHKISVFNKANDSDEVGILYGNKILNRIIPAANTKNLPVIAIGHSFGTRVIGRSVFSLPLLKDAVDKDGPELAILLQPAHSLNRFVRGEGVEGYPYVGFSDIQTKIIATTSRKDKANSAAVHAKYLGGLWGLKKAEKETEYFEFVEEMTNPSDSIAKIEDTHLVTVIDASLYIFDHNDVMSPETGELIAGLIQKYASND